MKFIIAAVALISPICAVCILGPVAFGSLLVGAVGWLGDFGPLAAIALTIAAGALVFRHILRKRARTPNSRPSPWPPISGDARTLK